MHHGYVPEPGQLNSGSRAQMEGPPPGQNFSYLQRVIDPQGAQEGRFE